MIEILKTPIFTHEVFSFSLPNFETYKKQIEQIVLVEENKSIHKIDTSPEDECNVKAKRTAWNSHQKYHALQKICDDVSDYIVGLIGMEKVKTPYLIIMVLIYLRFCLLMLRTQMLIFIFTRIKI